MEDLIIDDGNGISIDFLEGLNDNPNFSLLRNSSGFYELSLDTTKNQTIQRITGVLLKNGMPLDKPEKIEFKSNLYWWLMEGDTIANITYTYINEFTGELSYVNLPPLINWKDELIPTINSSSYTDSKTGVFNTVIAPIKEMIGDTMKISAEYNHPITIKNSSSKFLEISEYLSIKDSVLIILK